MFQFVWKHYSQSCLWLDRCRSKFSLSACVFVIYVKKNGQERSLRMTPFVSKILMATELFARTILVAPQKFVQTNRLEVAERSMCRWFWNQPVDVEVTKSRNMRCQSRPDSLGKLHVFNHAPSSDYPVAIS